MSTTPKGPLRSGSTLLERTSRTLFGGAVLLLCAYLLRPTQADGDGAVYVLQAIDASPWSRGVHVGFLAPLWATVRLGLAAGFPPSLSANLLSAAWTLAGLGAATALAAERLTADDASPGLGAWALVTPACLLAAPTTWRSALFCEVYGPLAALAVGLVAAVRFERQSVAAGTAALAVLVHPGALVLLPGLLLVGGLRIDDRRALRPLAAGAAALAAMTLLPSFWAGGRGLLDAAPADLSVFGSLQAGWRLVARDLGAAALPLLAGLAAAERRERLGLLWLVVGTAVVLGRWSDNPAWLPTLFVAATFAPRAILLPSPARAAPWGALVVVVAALGITEGTSRHDAEARRIQRESKVLARDCDPRDEPWRKDRLRALACREAELARP